MAEKKCRPVNRSVTVTRREIQPSWKGFRVPNDDDGGDGDDAVRKQQWEEE